MGKMYLEMNWYELYNCPGGDCGLTCCCDDWSISITDYEIQRYENMDNPFKGEILDAIDKEKKKMKCKNGKCMLLDENGFCKIVKNCGPEYLSGTCEIFPQKINDSGLVIEKLVEIVCPVVSNFLFDSRKIEFSTCESSVEIKISPEEANTYLSLFNARTFLTEMFQNDDYNYIYGKSFILFKVFESIKNLVDNGQLNPDNVNNILINYQDDVYRLSIFEQCEIIGNKDYVKEKILYKTLHDIEKNEIGRILFSGVNRYRKYILKTLTTWLLDENIFKEDLEKYVSFMKKEYPVFLQNFLVYSLTVSWTKTNSKEFGKEFASRVIELVAFELIGMAILKEKGTLDRKEFSVLISLVDRSISHAVDEQYNLLYDFYEKNQKENSAYFMLLLLG